MEIGDLLNSRSPIFTKRTIADPSGSPKSDSMSQAQVAQQSYHDIHKMEAEHGQELAHYDHLGRYSPPHLPQSQSYGHIPPSYSDPYGYASHSNMADASAMNQNPYDTTTSYHTNTMDRSHGVVQPQHIPHNQHSEGQSQNENGVKTFPCGNCSKSFARRSDLVRHERIHSGVRPHACQHPGCDKQFIQRSALTVHERVHTGEKPHQCEKCSKPFSDSSSLARHRRIHSGTRPYQCPHQDCLKTFTRRTTLTRHMSHHSGSVEQSAASRAAALASKAQAHVQESGHADTVDGDEHSEASSSAPSQHPDAASYGYPQGMAHTSQYAARRQSLDFYNSEDTSQLPTRDDLQHLAQQSPPLLSPQPQVSYTNHRSRQSITSNHVDLPPPVLEPPTNANYKTSKSASSSPQTAHVSSQNFASNMATQPYTYAHPLPNSITYYPSQEIRGMSNYDNSSRDAQHDISSAYSR